MDNGRSDGRALPPPRFLAWVLCEGQRFLAYRDFDGKWKGHDGREVRGSVTVSDARYGSDSAGR